MIDLAGFDHLDSEFAPSASIGLHHPQWTD